MQTDHKHKSRTHNDGIYSKLNSQPRICIGMLRICILLPMFTPYGLVINMEEMPRCVVLGVFLWSLCIIRWAKSGSHLHNNNIWGYFWSKFGHSIPGWPYIRLPYTVWQFILKEYHHALSYIYFCGYFALSNGPNWKVICILPIFAVNIWVFDLPDWPYIGLPPTV